MTTPEAMAFDEAEARTTHRWVEYMAMGADNTDFNGTGYFYCDDCGCAEDDAEASERCPESKVGDSRDEGALDWVTLETEDDAAKSLERLRRAYDDLQRIKEAAAVRIAEYQAAYNDIRRLEWPRLEDFHQRNKTDKKKSINLETGTIGVRSSGGSLIVENNDTACVWALEQGPEVWAAVVKEVEPTIRVKELKAMMSATPSLKVPGVYLTEKKDAFYVKGVK